MRVYTDDVLRNIIIENINNKKMVNEAARLYCCWLGREDREYFEQRLTGLLINEQYKQKIWDESGGVEKHH